MTLKNKKIAVIGGGSWGTAIAKIVLNNASEINWYVRDETVSQSLISEGKNSKYLRSVHFDSDKIHLSNDINETIKKSDILIFAIPSAFLKSALTDLKVSLAKKTIVSGIKGIIPEDHLIIGDYFNIVHHVPANQIAVVTGPCHAEEVALERLSYLTIAAYENTLATEIANLFRCSFIKATTSDDLIGTEYAAVLKNVMSVAFGICLGLGYGDNFLAVLVSNAIQEIKRFADKVYPIKRDIKESAYLGDLLVTTYSQFSRNRIFGNMIGKGYSVKAAMIDMNMVAEGYYATACIKEIMDKHQVEMPITEAVYNILYQKIAPSIEIKLLTEKLS